jgi:hypothetical protein
MFWNYRNIKRLKILNPDDFQIPLIISEDFQKMYGKEFVKSLGLADSNEINTRNEFIRFLYERPELRQKINDWNKSKSQTYNLPDDENAFLYYYKNENPYWLIVNEFLAEMQKDEHCPKKVKSFVQQTVSEVNNLFKMEKETADAISEKLSKVTRMEGVVEFLVTRKNEITMYRPDEEDNSPYEPTIIGQKAFSAVWTKDYIAPIPRWTRRWFWRFSGITYLIQKFANRYASAKAKRSAIIETFPQSIITDLQNGICQMLELNLLKTKNAKRLGLRRKKIHQFLSTMPNLRLKVYFQYNNNGLKMNLISVKQVIKSTIVSSKSLSYNRNYNGYTDKERKTITKNIETINHEVSESLAMQGVIKIMEFIKSDLNWSIGQLKCIKSPVTDQIFKWVYIRNLYNSPEHREAYKALTRQRHYFWQGMSDLHKFCGIINYFINTAKQHNLPLCMPIINNEKVGISFKKMAPIDMMHQNESMVPFSFPTINGHILCLTGKHGRGKSVAGNSILENLWLVQSGLPVFAESFNTDIKEMIGAVTNDSGDGSTATVFVKKTKNLFENINKVPAHKSLIFIDEIGKGTQENSGLKLGRQILKVLSGNGNSVIFNTQIMKLAEYARDNYKAICLKVNDKHQFEPGIGEGEMEELIKEIGLDKYLN